MSILCVLSQFKLNQVMKSILEENLFLNKNKLIIMRGVICLLLAKMFMFECRLILIHLLYKYYYYYYREVFF